MNQQLSVKREGEFEYKIVWHEDFSMLEQSIEELNLSSKRACIVTDSQVSALYGNQVKSSLESLFDTVTVFSFPAGEEQKNLDTVKTLYTHLIENKFDRKDILFALGGGVVGDLTGFAAATYLRGVDFIQIPTTLLSQVDSSIGGKTGVDFDQYKNMVGAFHQPRLVYMNMTTLSSLSDEQFSCGIGEVLKSGLIRNSSYYQWMIENHELVNRRDYKALVSMIQESCIIKKTVVEHDPTEQGERALLNLGHTIGHAVEKLKNFQLLHGQCVALGTVAAAYISYKRGYLSAAELDLIKHGNILYGLPVKTSSLTAQAVLEATKSDKKMEHGKIKFILLTKIGDAAVIKNVTDDELLEAVSYILES